MLCCPASVNAQLHSNGHVMLDHFPVELCEVLFLLLTFSFFICFPAEIVCFVSSLLYFFLIPVEVSIVLFLLLMCSLLCCFPAEMILFDFCTFFPFF